MTGIQPGRGLPGGHQEDLTAVPRHVAVNGSDGVQQLPEFGWNRIESSSPSGLAGEGQQSKQEGGKETV